MAKAPALYADAERLFVQDQLTLEAIAEILGVTPRTLQTWKSSGNWAEKRAGFIDLKSALDRDLYALAQKLIQRAVVKIEQPPDEEGRQPEIDHRAIYTALKCIAATKQAVSYEAIRKEDKPADPEKAKAEQKKSMSEKITDFFGINIEDDSENITGIDDLES